MNIEDEPSFRAVFLGNSQVGKTSLIQRIITGTFQSITTPTLAPEKSETKIPIDNTIYNVILWDIPRKEDYDNYEKTYIKSCNALYFVYDITDRKSFEDLEEYWIKREEDYISKECIIYLLGNKEELYDQSKVPDIEAQNLAIRNKYKFLTISAKEESNIKLIENSIREYNTIFEMKENKSFSLDIKDDFDSNIRIKSEPTCCVGHKRIIITTEQQYQNLEKNSENKEEKRQSLIKNNLEVYKEKEKKKLSNIRTKENVIENKESCVQNHFKFFMYFHVSFVIIFLIIILVIMVLTKDIMKKKEDFSDFRIDGYLKDERNLFCNNYLDTYLIHRYTFHNIPPFKKSLDNFEIKISICQILIFTSIILNLFSLSNLYFRKLSIIIIFCFILNSLLISSLVLLFVSTSDFKDEFLDEFIKFQEICHFFWSIIIKIRKELPAIISIN